jgi:hypothetical protein
VPKVAGKWLGGVDILSKVMEVWASGYPKMCICLANWRIILRLLCFYIYLGDVFAFHDPVFDPSCCT